MANGENNSAAIVMAIIVAAVVVAAAFLFSMKKEPVGTPNLNVIVNAPAANAPVVPPAERDSNKGNVSEPNGK